MNIESHNKATRCRSGEELRDVFFVVRPIAIFSLLVITRMAITASLIFLLAAFEQ